MYWAAALWRQLSVLWHCALCTVHCARSGALGWSVILFIFYNYVSHFTFYILIYYINQETTTLAILGHCQLYIEVIFSYSLKMPSWEPKHVAAMLFQLIIFYVMKLCWTIQLYISINHRKHNWMDGWMPHPKQNKLQHSDVHVLEM